MISGLGLARAAWSFAVIIGLGFGLAGCGGSPATPSLAASTRPPAATVPPTVAPTVPPRRLTYLAFGDSWPYGSHCHGCRPFPVLLKDGFAAAAEAEITFLNDVTNGGTAQQLAGRMVSDQRIRADIAAADIIVIAIGGNDLGPAFEAAANGSCGGADQLDCFRSVRDALRTAYDTMLTEIDGLRAGKPTAVRMVTTSNEFLADRDLIDMLGAGFGATGGVAVTRMNRDAQCEVALAHHALCIDLGLALNGPDLTSPLDVNTQAAMQQVADAILEPGVPELRP